MSNKIQISKSKTVLEFGYFPPARPAKGEAPPVGGPREADPPLVENFGLDLSLGF